MKQDKKKLAPDITAERTALWRALHVQIDSSPPIFDDEIGFKLIAPDDKWRQRPDMNPNFTKRLRASMVCRARFIEDLVIEQCELGIGQYVILGAGLDTFAQRRQNLAAKLQVFEIDQVDTLAWKRQRLIELGYGVPEWLHFVPVNFEISSWWTQLINSGFNPKKPTVVACTGVSLYLTKEAILTTLRQMAILTPGSTLAMSFYLPFDLLDEEDKPLQLIAEKGAKASGTPFISFFTPKEIQDLAYEAGFKNIKTIATSDLEKRYFINRKDHLRPASGEEFLITTT